MKKPKIIKKIQDKANAIKHLFTEEHAKDKAAVNRLKQEKPQKDAKNKKDEIKAKIDYMSDWLSRADELKTPLKVRNKTRQKIKELENTLRKLE